MVFVMGATLKTISEEVGISQAAVSMILNRRANDFSSQATRDKVFAIAKKLNYKQKFGHKVLRGESTRSVAVMIAMRRLLMEEQIQELVLLLLNKFEKSGYTPFLFTVAGNDAENLQMTRELIQRGMDHFVSIGCPCGFDAMEREIRGSGRTIIGFDSMFQRNLRNDTAYAIGETVKKFLAGGRTNFRVMVGSMASGGRIDAVAGVFPELSREEVVRRYIVCTGFGGEVDNVDEIAAAGYRATGEILAREPKVSALMYISDYHMVGGIRCLYERGIAVGRDIQLCGFNNIHAVRNGVFPLWTWQIDTEAVSETLFRECAGTEAFGGSVLPEFKVIS